MIYKVILIKFFILYSNLKLYSQHVRRNQYMALVKASQIFVMEGFTMLKKKKHWWKRKEYQRVPILSYGWVETICDESEAPQIIEEKIRNRMKKEPGRGKCFEGWKSYRKYFKPGELMSYPDGKVQKLKLDYIRDWKMEEIIKELDGNKFAALCKELGITAGEALLK